jgi:nucleoprotein TPR
VNKESNATQKVEDLTTKIQALERRSLMFERSGDDLGQVQHAFDDEVVRLRIDLGRANAELRLAKEEVETFKAISQASEDRLEEMNNTFDIYKSETEKSCQEMQLKVDKLELENVGLKEKLVEVGKSLTETQENMDNQVEAFNSANVLYERQIETLKENESQALLSVAQIRKDLEQNLKRVQESQDNYEREVMAHSNTLNTLSSLKQQFTAVKVQRDSEIILKVKSLNDLELERKSFVNVRKKLEDDLKEMEQRLEDINQQNRLLHSQFEQLSTSRTQFDENEDLGDDKQLLDLREVVKYLRREKDIVDTKLQISGQETERMKVQLEHLQKSLDESRIVIGQERQQNKSKDHSLKHQELLEKIEHANILRESNITLRTTLETQRQELTSFENKLTELTLQIEPLRIKLGESESEIEVRKAECKSLKEDNQRWKARAQQILEKYERIDPVEHERIIKELERLTVENSDFESRILQEREAYQLNLDESLKRVTV